MITRDILTDFTVVKRADSSYYRDNYLKQGRQTEAVVASINDED